MEELDFEGLFDPADNPEAISILEGFFGGIISLLSGGEGVASDNWLSAIFEIFNLAMLSVGGIILLYTALVTVFDTAADGKTMGNQTSARYTFLRVLGGGIAFVPISGGYSLVQIVILWLMIQASALADVTWRMTAETALSGRSMFAPPSQVSVADYPVQRQFGEAFDTLVTGFICAYNGNNIDRIMDGQPERDITSGPIVFKTPGIAISRPPASYSPDGTLTLELMHLRFFGEVEGSTAFSQRDSYCGAVWRNVSVVEFEAATVQGASANFQETVLANIKRQRFEAYQEAINEMADDAAEVGLAIFNGERNVNVLRAMTGASIREATVNYMSGVNAISVPQSDIDGVHEALLDQVSNKGWIYAPAWQRSIAMAAAANSSPFADFNINTSRENEIVEYLTTGRGVDSSVVAAYTRKIEDDQWTWDSMNGYIEGLETTARRAENEGDVAFAPINAGLPDNDDALAELMNDLYRYLRDFSSDNTAVIDGEGSSFYKDPMVSVVEYGNKLMVVGAGFGGAAAFGELIGGVPFVGGAGEALAGFAWPLAYAFLVAGFATATIIPLLPMAYFFGAIVSWFMLVMESLFAVPLATLSLFTPARDGTLIGAQNKVLLSLFGIFLRPFFAVVGLIFGMMLIAFALGLLYDLFYGLLDFIIPQGGLQAILGLLGVVVVFLMLSFYTVMYGASLITELGDAALNWLGVVVSQFAGKMNAGENLQGDLSGRVGGQLSPSMARRSVSSQTKLANADKRAERAEKYGLSKGGGRAIGKQ